MLNFTKVKNSEVTLSESETVEIGDDDFVEKVCAHIEYK